MYFWLRSATSNIHEAIPQTRWGEGARVLQTRSIPPTSIIHQPLNASENCLNIHHSNLAGGYILNWRTVQTRMWDQHCSLFFPKCFEIVGKDKIESWREPVQSGVLNVVGGEQ